MPLMLLAAINSLSEQSLVAPYVDSAAALSVTLQLFSHQYLDKPGLNFLHPRHLFLQPIGLYSVAGTCLRERHVQQYQFLQCV